jgi:hypothetical protein
MELIDYIEGNQAIKAIYGTNFTTSHKNQILKMEFGFGKNNYIDMNFHICEYPQNLQFLKKYPIESNFYKINFVFGGIVYLNNKNFFLNEDTDFHLNGDGEVLSFIFKNTGELLVNCRKATCRNILPYSTKPFYKKIKRFDRLDSLQNIPNIHRDNEYLSLQISILYIEILIEFSELLIALNIEGQIMHLLVEGYSFDSFFESLDNNQGEFIINSLHKSEHKIKFTSKDGSNSCIIKCKDIFYDFDIDYHYNRRIYNIYN